MLYLIRHCSTSDNDSQTLLSDKDYGLSDRGIQQATKLGDWFSDKKIDIILTSVMQRAVQTAEFISKTTKTPIVQYSELRERHVDKQYSSLSLEQLLAIRKSEAHNFIDHAYDWNNVSDVESDKMIYERTRKVLQKHISNEKNIVCVTHGGVIKSFLHCSFQIDKSRTNAFKVRNGCVLMFQNENNIDNIQLTNMYQLQSL